MVAATAVVALFTVLAFASSTASDDARVTARGGGGARAPGGCGTEVAVAARAARLSAHAIQAAGADGDALLALAKAAEAKGVLDAAVQASGRVGCEGKVRAQFSTLEGGLEGTQTRVSTALAQASAAAAMGGGPVSARHPVPQLV